MEVWRCITRTGHNQEPKHRSSRCRASPRTSRDSSSRVCQPSTKRSHSCWVGLWRPPDHQSWPTSPCSGRCSWFWCRDARFGCCGGGPTQGTSRWWNARWCSRVGVMVNVYVGTDWGPPNRNTPSQCKASTYRRRNQSIWLCTDDPIWTRWWPHSRPICRVMFMYLTLLTLIHLGDVDLLHDVGLSALANFVNLSVAALTQFTDNLKLFQCLHLYL